MKTYILMAKSGYLFQAYPVRVLEKLVSKSNWEIYAGHPNGWIINNPQGEAGMGIFWVFVNDKWFERDFEILGEL